MYFCLVVINALLIVFSLKRTRRGAFLDDHIILQCVLSTHGILLYLPTPQTIYINKVQQVLLTLLVLKGYPSKLPSVSHISFPKVPWSEQYIPCDSQFIPSAQQMQLLLVGTSGAFPIMTIPRSVLDMHCTICPLEITRRPMS